MSHFLGTHQNRLDAKGRVSVPAPFRASLRKLAGETEAPFMVLRPSHQLACIEAWPGTLFEQLSTPLDRLELFSEAHSDMATTLFSEAWPMEPDREGRIVLPDDLARHAGLGGMAGDPVVFMGLGRLFQIWEPGAAERRRAEARDRTRSRAITLPAGSS
jgi:MraZ protein